jgi:hypothetical protein
LIRQFNGVPRVPSRPFEFATSPEPSKPVREIGCAGPTSKSPAKKPGALGKTPLRAVVRISNNLPVTQVEIEVIASLLDDWESLFLIATEAAE